LRARKTQDKRRNSAERKTMKGEKRMTGPESLNDSG